MARAGGFLCRAVGHRGGDAVTSWTFAGPKLVQPRPSWTIAVLAFIFAWSVMTDVPASYPGYMIVLAFAGSAWCCVQGVKARAWVAWLFAPTAALWLNPLFDADWFTRQGPIFFGAHSALALLFAIAAYTYLAREKHP